MFHAFLLYQGSLRQMSWMNISVKNYQKMISLIIDRTWSKDISEFQYLSTKSNYTCNGWPLATQLFILGCHGEASDLADIGYMHLVDVEFSSVSVQSLLEEICPQPWPAVSPHNCMVLRDAATFASYSLGPRLLWHWPLWSPGQCIQFSQQSPIHWQVFWKPDLHGLVLGVQIFIFSGLFL